MRKPGRTAIGEEDGFARGRCGSKGRVYKTYRAKHVKKRRCKQSGEDGGKISGSEKSGFHGEEERQNTTARRGTPE